MAIENYQQPKIPTPRKLEEQETLQTLNHWRNIFINYYRRCQFFGYFLLPGTKWDSSENRGFTAAETSGLKRSPTVLAADLSSFLACLGGYLPFDYVTEKLNAETYDMNSVWKIIYEIYDAEINTVNFLDFASMSRNSGETYRNYYNRLVGFVRQHLPTSRIEAEGVKSPTTGETLSIALLDTIAICWLNNIDKRLVSIIKTEFAAELKQKRLCEMIKTIATCIDELLQRYATNMPDQINAISGQSTVSKHIVSKSNNEVEPSVNTIIRRLERLESRNRYPRRSRNKKFNKKLQCSHCTFVNNKIGSSLSTDHRSDQCGRKKLSVSVVESFGEDKEWSSTTVSSQSSEEGEMKRDNFPTNSSPFQNELVCDSRNNNCSRNRFYPSQDAAAANVCHLVTPYYVETGCPKLSCISDKRVNHQLNPLVQNTESLTDNRGKFDQNEENSYSLIAALESIRNSSYKWNEIQKSKSPRIQCELHQVRFTCLVDSGAEVNVIDHNLATRLGIHVAHTRQVAQAANKLPLNVVGQSKNPISFHCLTLEGKKMIFLGIVLIVNNLGIDCLIGEPGKAENNIVCLPRQQMVILADGKNVHSTPYCSDNPRHNLVRSSSQVTLLPGENMIHELSADLSHLHHVAITPRKQALSWLKPSILEVQDGKISLFNSSKIPVIIPKNSHLADIRDTTEFECPPQARLVINETQNDSFQYADFSKSQEQHDSYLHLIQVDPDNVLSQDEREVFHSVHKRFAHLFTPRPGKYNGAYGPINNRLHFSSPPPPNSKTRIPNYSPDMNKIMAKKMDELEEWGVLAVPESLGVTVEFVSPSMLVPKTDPGEFRLVTDFASLNVYLKRVPNTSATIAQARSKIARSRYVIHLDFSNFFYQNGMQRIDVQYLGTVHPFKGLRVYTCDPQGLKGASERSYEKLVRIYGDMIQEDKLAQMADGIHVLGDTIQQLAINYIEVLNRAESSGFTFKPKKVIICPKNINLFGWDLRGRTWYPTSHTTSALANATRPSTIKQLRSFLGAFKQLSSTLPNYAVTIHKLDKLVGGRKSAERIQWTEDLTLCFTKAKELASNPIGIVEPRPDDTLHTFSDYSQENRAIGGRLMIHRANDKGGVDELVGGFFSTILDKHKKAWLPCEGEAAAIRLVLQHFQHFIRESKNTTIHHTDSQPCVLAWKKSQRGAFSSSARISSFLVGLSSLPVEIRYKPGKLMNTSDFASRNPSLCTTKRCQVCSFVEDWENVGDNASSIKTVSIEEINSGKSIMPMIQRKTWLNIQKGDSLHNKLSHLIETQQLPESRKTGGDYTKLKLLHNQYTLGKLFIAEDGLIMLKSATGHFSEAVISVPPSIFPGLINALHVRLDHPSKGQLSKLVARYFYSPGWQSYVEEISDNCHQCASLRQLPKVLLENTFSPPSHIATEFAADVIERSNQKILIVKEKFSQYLRGTIIPDQKTDTLRDALLSLILDLVSDEGATIRVDGATSFQALERESNTRDSILTKLKIKVVVGRLLNKNKNPAAENSVKEVHKEVLRLTNKSGPISKVDLELVLRNINSRIRQHGFSSKEVLFRRKNLTNQELNVEDKDIIDKIVNAKEKSKCSNTKSKLKSHKYSPFQQFAVGNLVHLRNAKDKLSPRDLFIVEKVVQSNDTHHYYIRKLQTSLRPRLYKVLPDEIILSPQHLNPEAQKQIISGNDSSKSKSDDATLNSTQPSLSKDKPEDKVQRPKRKAAIAAREKWNHPINSLQARKFNTHGWNTEDQDSDEDDFIITFNSEINDRTPTSSVSSDSLSSYEPRSRSVTEEKNNSVGSTTSSSNFSGNFVTEQVQPTPQRDDLEEIGHSSQSPSSYEGGPTIEYREFPQFPHCSTPIYAMKRNRRMATSDSIVTRSNAFRNPPEQLDEATLASPEESDAKANQDLETSIRILSEDLLTMVDSPARHHCPTPHSPNNVDLNQVNILSRVLPVQEDIADQSGSDTRNDLISSHEVPTNTARSRRSTNRPRDYDAFHRYGRRT